MPCDSGPHWRDESPTLKQELDHVTQLLCQLCKHIDFFRHHGGPTPLLALIFPPEVNAWWQKHCELDRQRQEAEAGRLQREMLRQRAIEKLSPEERAVLNIA